MAKPAVDSVVAMRLDAKDASATASSEVTSIVRVQSVGSAEEYFFLRPKKGIVGVANVGAKMRGHANEEVLLANLRIINVSLVTGRATVSKRRRNTGGYYTHPVYLPRVLVRESPDSRLPSSLGHVVDDAEKDANDPAAKTHGFLEESVVRISRRTDRDGRFDVANNF
jgi:hypothetical protein